MRLAIAVLAAAAGLSLAPGCRTLPPSESAQAALLPLYQQRAERLAEHHDWTLEGRLAISDGRDGGSGRLAWAQGRQFTHMDFHGALGRGAWRLDADAGGAALQFADGSRYAAASVDELVVEQLGWQVPVEPLRWWVRGLAAPGSVDAREFDEQGRLTRLQQSGWAIEYGRYGTFAGLDMPLKMTARQDDRSVKLAVRQWVFSASDD